MDQLFGQLSFVDSIIECDQCHATLFNDIQHKRFKPLIFNQHELILNETVLVNLCSRVSHNLWFTFGIESSIINNDNDNNNIQLKMVEETHSPTTFVTTNNSSNRMGRLQHAMGCRYYHHPQKRPSSVNSSSSGNSDHTKESDPECITDSVGSDGGNTPSLIDDYGYGPGFVGRLRNKFMTMYSQDHHHASSNVNQNGQTTSAIKRCSSMEELTYRTKNGVSNGLVVSPIPSTVGTVAKPTSNGTNHHGTINGSNYNNNNNNNNNNNHHQQVNGTKKRLLWNAMNGNSSTAINNYNNNNKQQYRSAFVKNGHHIGTKTNNSNNDHLIGENAKTSSSSSLSSTTKNGSLYPSNIVKNIVKSHEHMPKQVIMEHSNKSSINGSNSNSSVRHYPSPITHNYVRSNLLLTTPLPYIRKAKSVETLSASYLINGTTNGTTDKSYLVPVDISTNINANVNTSTTRTNNGTNDGTLVCDERNEHLQSIVERQRRRRRRALSTGNVLDDDEFVELDNCAIEDGDHNMVEYATTTQNVTTNGGIVVDMIAIINGEQEQQHQYHHESNTTTTITTPDECKVSNENGGINSVDLILEEMNNNNNNSNKNFGKDTNRSNLDSNSSLLLENDDSGICDVLASSIGSSSTSNTIDEYIDRPNMNEYVPPTSTHHLISDSEMPQPDIVKTYKRLFESPDSNLINVATSNVSSPPSPSSQPPLPLSTLATVAVKSSPMESTITTTATNNIKCDDDQQSVTMKPIVPNRINRPTLRPSPTIPPRNGTIKPPITPRTISPRIHQSARVAASGSNSQGMS